MKDGFSFPTRSTALLALQALVVIPSGAQTHVPLQPFIQQVRQVETALEYLGQPLSRTDRKAINESIAEVDEASAVSRLEHILDHYTLAMVEQPPHGQFSYQQLSSGSRDPDPCLFIGGHQY